VSESRLNPFNVTKASDFNDAEIAAYFVDIPGSGFSALANPTSPMPMLIRGGKGSGKTHLMRYFSYPLQKLRHGPHFVRGIREEGYVGIYHRCGGLNASRFRGKNQTPEVWDSIFSYYMEIWLSQLLLGCASDLASASHEPLANQSTAVKSCLDLLDNTESIATPTTFVDFIESLHALQRALDLEVNNCALTGTLSVHIRATAGRLIFGIPKVLTSHLDSMKGLKILYLIDEFENLTEPQQRYVNTLLREKELPSSFKIGGRSYGFKTFRTLSGEEDIKEGSEYEVLPLDVRLRDNKQYKVFAERLCARRLIQAGYAPSPSTNLDDLARMLVDAFEGPESDYLLTADTAFVLEKYKGRERPYFSKLRQRMKDGISADAVPGIRELADVEAVIRSLESLQHPILEKVNIFRLYQEWRTSKDLKDDAIRISEQCKAFLNGERTGEYASLVDKRKADLLAQLLRECDQPQRYLGFDTFVEMSEGLPRNLLVILKGVFSWATFNGEQPLSSGKMSITSQRQGTRDAAEWFFDDARMPGDDGAAIRAGVSRLATLFRDVRFSDKPSEKAVCTFSVNLAACSLEAQRIINLAEKWSLLIAVAGGQRDRNTMRVDEKYYINSMLAPKWDLPVARGGALELNPREVNSIFDPSFSTAYEELLRDRVERMMAPFFSARKRLANGESAKQTGLPLEGADA